MTLLLLQPTPSNYGHPSIQALIRPTPFPDYERVRSKMVRKMEQGACPRELGCSVLHLDWTGTEEKGGRGRGDQVITPQATRPKPALVQLETRPPLSHFFGYSEVSFNTYVKPDNKPI